MVTWLVDGNNLSCSRKVPNERSTIIHELRKIASPRCPISDEGAKNLPKKIISNVVVVFDGSEDEHSEETKVDDDLWFRYSVTNGKNRKKDRADDFIVDIAIPHLKEIINERQMCGRGSTKVHLVSADKELQNRVRSTRVMNGGSVVHPPKFWKEYLPILQQQQQRY